MTTRVIESHSKKMFRLIRMRASARQLVRWPLIVRRSTDQRLSKFPAVETHIASRGQKYIANVLAFATLYGIKDQEKTCRSRKKTTPADQSISWYAESEEDMFNSLTQHMIG